MNIKSLSLYSVVLLGTEYLLLGVFGLFLLARPALVSIVDGPVRTQEILWAAVHIPKPSTAPMQVSSAPSTDAPSPTQAQAQAPDIVLDVVDTGSSDSGNAPVENQGPDDWRWIDVNLSEQRLYAYEGNILANSFLVSTGLPGTPTVTGEFRIYIKVPVQDMSGPGYYLTDVPWVMFFYDEYGFHGTYWHNNFGSPMSRGCVNLRTEDAEWLYNWASVGTPVNIHY